MLLTAKGRSYFPTGVDRLWLLRAVQAEGEPMAQVASTLVNGFMWARCQGYRLTLTDWIRSYAQPVNPRHYRGGDLFRITWNAASPAKRAELEKVATKRELHHSTRVSFDAATEHAVDLAFSTPPTLAQATDYAAAHIDAGKKGYVPLTPAQKGLNRFWYRPAALGWNGYRVVVSGAHPVIAVAVVGLVLWALSRT